MVEIEFHARSFFLCSENKACYVSRMTRAERNKATEAAKAAIHCCVEHNGRYVFSFEGFALSASRGSMVRLGEIVLRRPALDYRPTVARWVAMSAAYRKRTILNATQKERDAFSSAHATIANCKCTNPISKASSSPTVKAWSQRRAIW